MLFRSVWVFLSLAPADWPGLQCSQTKTLQQGPDTHTHTQQNTHTEEREIKKEGEIKNERE